MKRSRFVWIDDQRRKVEIFRAAFQAGIPALKMSASIELVEVKNNVLDDLQVWVEQNGATPPDLLIIDHVFNVGLPFGLNGSSVAHLLRRKFASTPMVCVTAMLGRPDAFDQEDLSEYTAIFSYDTLADNLESLYAIARDFKKLCGESTQVREHLVACLRAPRRDQIDLLRLLPEEFQNQRHVATEHRMARWILNDLLARPGFLYDRLHAATLLGLTEDAFGKVEQMFTRALYKGVFGTTTNPLWWASELRHILFAASDENGPDVPQLAGRSLPGIAKGDHSTCYISKTSDPPPDAVVLADATRDAVWRVVRREFAGLHPNAPGTPPGFEPRLVLVRKAR